MVVDEYAQVSVLQSRRSFKIFAYCLVGVYGFQAYLIWGFDILPAIDPDTGKEVYPDLNDYSEVERTSTLALGD